MPIDSVTIERRGAFQATMLHVDGSATYPMNAVYREFAEPQRMVFEAERGITGTIEPVDLGDGKTEFKWTTRAVLDESFWPDSLRQ